MTRESALNLVSSYVGNKNLVKHMIAVSSAMKLLAEHLNGDPEKWEIAGLLHDIDYDLTVNNFERHGIESYKILTELNVDEEVKSAIRAHPAHKQHMPKNKMEWALHIVDPLTGLIVASALMHPSRKLASVDTEFVLRRFNEKRFAAGANREQIKLCEEKLGIPLPKFIEITLNAMKSVADEIGL